MKIATVGTGVIVDNFMDACLKNDIKITAMYSRKIESATYLSNKYDINRIYTDYLEMLSSSNIDFIYIASPNSIHFDQVRLALINNKHVICEKPFTSTSTELKELIELAKSKNLFLFEAITTIYLPHFNSIQEKLTSIGKINMINCNFSKYSSRYKDFKDGKNPNIFNPEFSGGALVDLNIYNIHFVVSLFGLPLRSKYIPFIEENAIDTSGVIVMEFSDKIATCIASKNSESESYAIIQGEKGYIKTSATGGLHLVEIHTANNVEILNSQQDLNNLFYEVLEFKHMFKNKNFSKCYDNLDYSYTIIKLIESIRLNANIVFSADKRK